MNQKTAPKRQTATGLRGPRPPRRPPGKKPAPAPPSGKLPRRPAAPKPTKQGGPPPRRPVRTKSRLQIPWLKLFLPLLVVALIAAGLAGYIYYRGAVSLPEIEGSLRLPGLAASVDVLRDLYGIPHIFASSLEDLARANGYVHAQDRYFQMEVGRRMASGTLAEVFGAELVALDKQARRLALGQAAQSELERLDPSTQRFLQAYAEGVNSYREANLERLAPEFQVLELSPAPWTPADTIVISKWLSYLLSFNGSVELLRAHLSEAVGVESAYELTGLVAPEPERAALRSPPVPYLDRWAPQPAASNAWVVSGSRTASGLPLLASDPHLPLAIPSLWYEIHLQGGGLNVAGAGLPGIPLVLIGHNERIAWGITASFADVQDHYVETLNPEDPNQYAAGDQWETFHVTNETISVADSSPLEVEFKWSRHGVVVSDQPREGKVLALRWDSPWNGNNLSAFLQLNMAASWLEFTEALRSLGGFPFAFVYADVEGNIGFFPSGDIPLRSGFDGSVPVDGSSGTFEWEGIIPHEMKPSLFNPEEGYIVCANHNMVPDDTTYAFGRDQLAPFRATRITSLLTSARALRPEDFATLQADRYDSSAEPILRYLVSLPLGSDEDAMAAQDLLRAWNGQMTTGAPPAIYQAFYVRLIENTFKDELGDELFSEFLEFLELGYYGGVFTIIDDPSSGWWDDRQTPNLEDRKAIFNRSLQEALALLGDRQGNDPEGWDWATLHSVAFEHLLGRQPPLNWIFNRGPTPFGGSAFTVANSVVSLANPFDVPAGTSFRLVVDLSDLNATLSSIPTGASGHPLSSHYFDQNQGWLKGDSHPLLFERSRIEAAQEGKLTLVP